MSIALDGKSSPLIGSVILHRRRHGDAETRRRGAFDASQPPCPERKLHGSEAPSESKIQAFEIGRGHNPRSISVPASPRLPLSASLREIAYLEMKLVLVLNSGTSKQSQSKSESLLLHSLHRSIY